MSIRLRLTLLYSVILALTLVAFSVTLYFVLSFTTYRVIETTLAAEAQRIIDGIVPERRAISFPVNNNPKSTTYFQLRELDGNIFTNPDGSAVRTNNLGNDVLPLGNAALADVRQNNFSTEWALLQDERVMIYNKRFPDTNLVVQVARSVDAQDQLLKQLRTFLIIGSSVAMLLAFGAGWLLSRTALRPINRLTQTAQAIGVERNFARRVDYQGPHDELGRLARTFNGMLEALEAAYKQEAQALQAQRRFVADASHELRTPLTTIRGNLALLQREPPISPPDRVAVLGDMVSESERMGRLVGDLLALARADAGRPLRREALSVAPILEDLCRKGKALAPQRTVNCSISDDATVWADPDALTQVLLILLDNALKWTPPDGTITLTTAVCDEHVALAVRDTGVGIIPTVLPHIFERFFRGDAARTGGGAGLGLAIARTLVATMGGTITAESTVGQGSVFTVTLPRAGVLAA